MSATCRIYTIERAGYTVPEAIDMVKKLFNRLCQGEDKQFHYNFELTGIDQLDECRSRFRIINKSLVFSFETEKATDMNALLLATHLYKEVYFYNYKSEAEKTYPGFWLQFNSIQQKIKFRLGLPYAAGIQKSREELAPLLKFLVASGVMWMVEKEVDEIAALIIDLNARGFRGNWVYQDFIEISAPGNYTPLNSDLARPAEVYIHFSEKDYARMGGYEKMGIACNNALNEYFAQQGYRVRGSIVSETDSGIAEKLKEIAWGELRISVCADISRFSEFSANDLEFSGGGREGISVSNFIWKDSETDCAGNNIALSIMDRETCQLEIAVGKEVAEGYFRKIEEMIQEKLILRVTE